MLPPTRSSEGYRLLSQGQLAAAEQEFRAALQADPKDAKCLIGLARTLQANGGTDEALKTLEQLFTVKPDHLEGRSLRGLLLTLKGDTKGVKDLEEAAKDRRSGAQEHINYGLYLAGKDDGRAQKEFELALRVDNRNYRAFVELGKLCERRKDFRAALVQYQKATEFAMANDATPFILRARTHAALGEHVHAAVAALEAVNRGSDAKKAEILPDAFRICIEGGEFDSAVKVALAARELDANNSEYETWLAQASMGARKAGGQKPKETKEIFDEEVTLAAAKSKPSAKAIEAAKTVNMVETCELAEQALFRAPPAIDEALKLIEPCLIKSPDDPRANMAQGLALALKGDYAKAYPHAQKAMAAKEAYLKEEAESLVKACEKKIGKR